MTMLTIVGIQHQRDGIRILDVLRPDSPVLLLREPTNLHDPNAIMALVPLGYVKAAQAKILAQHFSNLSTPILAATLYGTDRYSATVEVDLNLSDDQKDLFND